MGDKEKIVELRGALEDAKAKLLEQQEFIKGMMDASHGLGTVVEIHGERMILTTGSGQIEAKYLSPANLGDQVTLLMPDNNPVGVMKNRVPTGVVGIVREVGVGQVQVELDGSVRAVRTALTLQAGERVVIDTSLTAAIGSLGMPKAVASFEPALDITWDDIGGQIEAKRQLREAIELPFKNPELFQKYGKRPVRGVLLYGPPGNGKTLLARAAATAMAKVHGLSKAEGFTYVKGPSLLSKYVGESEANIRAIFTAAREHKEKFGFPALVFIDEADALLRSRSDDTLGINSITVPQFLAEMDGLEDTGALMVLATNKPDLLDSAVVREGRIDRKVKVERPNQATAESILAIHLKKRPVSEPNLESWAAEQVFNGNLRIAKGIALRDAVSGAMLSGIVEEASTRAMMRDMESDGKCTGIGREDLSWAIGRTAQQTQDTDLRELTVSGSLN